MKGLWLSTKLGKLYGILYCRYSCRQKFLSTLTSWVIWPTKWTPKMWESFPWKPHLGLTVNTLLWLQDVNNNQCTLLSLDGPWQLWSDWGTVFNVESSNQSIVLYPRWGFQWHLLQMLLCASLDEHGSHDDYHCSLVWKLNLNVWPWTFVFNITCYCM